MQSKFLSTQPPPLPIATPRGPRSPSFRCCQTPPETAAGRQAGADLATVAACQQYVAADAAQAAGDAPVQARAQDVPGLVGQQTAVVCAGEHGCACGGTLLPTAASRRSLLTVITAGERALSCEWLAATRR